MSCGGNLAIEAARDPRVKTLGVWNSGVWISGEMRSADGTLLVATTKADLGAFTAQLYINGDKLDPAVVNAADDFERLNQVPVFFGSRHGSGHSGTYSHANGGEFANVAVALAALAAQGKLGVREGLHRPRVLALQGSRLDREAQGTVNFLAQRIFRGRIRQGDSTPFKENDAHCSWSFDGDPAGCRRGAGARGARLSPLKPAAPSAHYSVATTLVGKLLDDPAADAVLKKMIPTVYANEMFKTAGRELTLKQIQQYEPEAL